MVKCSLYARLIPLPNRPWISGVMSWKFMSNETLMSPSRHELSVGAVAICPTWVAPAVAGAGARVEMFTARRAPGPAAAAQGLVVTALAADGARHGPFRTPAPTTPAPARGTVTAVHIH